MSIPVNYYEKRKGTTFKKGSGVAHSFFREFIIWRMITFELTCSRLMPNAAYLSNPEGMLSKNSRLSNVANKYKRDAWVLVLWPIFRKMP